MGAGHRLTAMVLGVCCAAAAEACGPIGPSAPKLDLQQTVIAQYIDGWLHMLDSSQNVQGLVFRSRITKRGAVDGQPLSGAVFATRNVPADQNFVNVAWTASDGATGEQASGRMIVKDIRVLFATGVQGQALDPADQANGVQWRGRIEVEAALSSEGGKFLNWTLKNDRVVVKGGRVQDLPTPGPGRLLVADPAIAQAIQPITSMVDVMFRGKEASGGLSECRQDLQRPSYVQLDVGNAIDSVRVTWSSGSYHGAGEYRQPDVTVDMATLGLLDPIKRLDSFTNVVVTVKPDLRSGTVEFAAVAHLRPPNLDQIFTDPTEKVTYSGRWVCPVEIVSAY